MQGVQTCVLIIKKGDQSENFSPITWHVIRNLDGGKNIFVDIQGKPMAKASTNFDGNIKRNSKGTSMANLITIVFKLQHVSESLGEFVKTQTVPK